MNRIACIITAFALGACATAPVPATAQVPAPEAGPRTIFVNATAVVHRAPDRAVIALAVETTGRTAADASSANAERMSEVIEAVRRMGLEDRQIRTSRLELMPQYERTVSRDPVEEPREPRITGYIASNQVTVTVDDVGVVGRIMDAAVAAGARHSLALKADGTVWGWGYNNNGELGDGTSTQRALPVQAAGLNDALSIAAWGFQSYAVGAEGTLWAWGYNANGQLGDGTTAAKLRAVQVGNVLGGTAIAAGADHALFLDADGSVWAAGYNGNGQLGDGTQTQRSSPVQVLGGLSSVVAIAAGGRHSAALKSDGTLIGKCGLARIEERVATAALKEHRIVRVAEIPA